MSSGSLAIVRASAGSGKTFTLALEYCKAVVQSPTAYRHILAVTFTNKATAEMKRRIIEELSALAEGRGSVFADKIVQSTGLESRVVADRARQALGLILTDFSSFSVMTIDKFFQRIVRSFFKELGLDFSYTIEIESSSSMAQAIDLTIEDSATDHTIKLLIERVVGERLDRGASWNVRQELLKIGYEILKEEYRKPEGQIKELISTFGELKKEYDQSVDILRIKALEACRVISDAGLSAHDFKYGVGSFAQYLFRIAAADQIEAYGARFAALPDNPESAYTDKSPAKDQIVAILPQIVSLTREIIELYDSTLVSRSTYEVLSPNFSRYLLLERIKDNFSKVLSLSGKLAISSTTDFIDRIAREASVPFIFEKLGTHYTTIFIDEFQDTSWAQWRGFLPLLHEAVAASDSTRRVMLIGDVKQAIYRWRGGDWDILGTAAGREFEAALEADTEELNTSFRSEKHIVEFNNTLIKNILREAQGLIVELVKGDRNALFDELITVLARSYGAAEQKVAPHKATPERGYAAIDKYSDTEQAMQNMLDNVKNAIKRGYRPSDIAILVRRGAEGATVARTLIGAGFSIVSEDVLALSSSMVVNFVLNVFRFAIDQDAIALVAINGYLGRDFQYEPGADELKFLQEIKQRPSVEAIESTIVHYALQEAEPAYLQALYEQIYRFTIDQSSDTGAFLKFWDENNGQFKLKLSGSDNSINILTIHKAKGLEFEVVIIPLAEWSTAPSSSPPTRLWVSTNVPPYDQFNPFPLNYTSTLADSVYRDEYLRQGVYSVVDNLNLLYVALTRAKVELYVGVPEKSAKNTIGSLITSAIEAISFDHHAGTRQQAVGERVETEKTLRITRLESYAQRSQLDIPSPEDDGYEDL